MAPPSTARNLAICFLAAVLLAPGSTYGSGEEAVQPGASDPQWLMEAMEHLDAGIVAYFDASFDAALSSLRSAVKALVTGHDEYPVERASLVRSVIFLILTLHALDRDDEAAEFATGLGEVVAPPWGEGLDLSPAAREFLDHLQDDVELPDEGALVVGVPDDACEVELDGQISEQAEAGTFVLLAGVHWVRISCNGLFSAYFKTVVSVDETTTLDPGPLDLAGVDVEDSPSPASDLLIGQGHVQKKPWYGDGLNLVLQGVAVVALGVGAGLLAGSMSTEKKAMTTTSLAYVGLQDRSLDMQISGWSLLGAGALGLVIGVVRMAITGGQDA